MGFLTNERTSKLSHVLTSLKYYILVYYNSKFNQLFVFSSKIYTSFFNYQLPFALSLSISLTLINFSFLVVNTRTYRMTHVLTIPISCTFPSQLLTRTYTGILRRSYGENFSPWTSSRAWSFHENGRWSWTQGPYLLSLFSLY